MERAGSSRNAENGSHLVPDEGIYAVFAFRYEPIRRKRLTPGRDGCRRRPCRVGGRVRYERKCRNRLTPGSDGCRRGPCEADGVPAIADKSWGWFWL